MKNRPSLRSVTTASAACLPRRTALAIMLNLALAGSSVAVTTFYAPDVVVQTVSQTKKNFDVRGGSLEDALNQFARQAGITLSFDPVLAQGKIAAPMAGQYTIEEGFAILLSGSKLKIVRAANGSFGLQSAMQGAVYESVLPEVNVMAAADRNALSADYAGGQLAKGGRVGMLGNMNSMDTPFSVTAFTAKTVEDTQANTIADVVRLDPSVRSTGMAADNTDAFFIRGFAIGDNNIGEVAFDGMYGAGPNYRMMADYAERIEILKGPAAMIYGMSPSGAGGGTINVVPKRAEEDLTRVRASYGNGSQVGTHADIARRFGAEREFGVRFNGAYQNGDTPLDNQSLRSGLGALALDYRGSRLHAVLDLIDQTEYINAPSRRPSLAAGVAVPAAPDGKRNTTQPWEFSDSRERSVSLRTEYEVNDNLQLFAAAATGKSEVERLFNTPTILSQSGNNTVTPSAGRFEVRRDSVEAGMRGRFETAGIKHRVTLQWNRYNDELARSTINGTAYTSNIYQPVSYAVQNVALPANAIKASSTTLNGVALTDTLSAYDERLLLILGLRHQQVGSENYTAGVLSSRYDRSALTPAVGVVVKPVKDVSLYANYIEGLAKGDIAPNTASNAGEIFAPYKTKQQEVGIKLDQGKLMTTLSLFQIARPGGQLLNNVYSVGGEQRNRGMELSVYGTPVDGVRLYSALAWTQAILTKTNTPATQGNTAVGVPRIQIGLNGEWDMSMVPGLTAVGGIFYGGKQYIDQANLREIPSWTTVDLGVRYRSRIAGRDVTWRGGVKNVFDRHYWSGASTWGTLALGAPRTFLFSATIDF